MPGTELGMCFASESQPFQTKAYDLVAMKYWVAAQGEMVAGVSAWNVYVKQSGLQEEQEDCRHRQTKCMGME